MAQLINQPKHTMTELEKTLVAMHTNANTAPEQDMSSETRKYYLKYRAEKSKLRKLKAVIESHRNASKSQDVKTTCNYILWNIEEIFKG